MRHATTISMLTALALLAGLPALAADESPPPYVAEAPGAEAHPRADGLVLREATRLEVLPDGRVKRHEERAVKILTDYLNRRGEFDPTLTWNDARQKLEVLEARTYMADGTIVEPEANSFVPNTPRVLAWAPDYAHIRQQTIVQVGVEIGSTSVLAYEVEQREPAGHPLWGSMDLFSYMPVLEREVVVELPQDQRLRHAAVGCRLQPEVDRGSGVTRYVFRHSQPAPLNLREARHPDPAGCRLVISTADGWGDVREFLRGRIEPALTADETLAAKAEELTEGALFEEETIGKLHAFVRDGIRTLGLPLETFAYEVRPASRVLETSAGHPLEKAVLLAALIRAAGLEADVALVDSYRCRPVPGVPAPQSFDEPWVVTGRGDERRWLDPLRSPSAARRVDLDGSTVLELGTGVPSDAPPAVLPGTGEHLALLAASLELAPGEGGVLSLSGHLDVDLRGRYHPAAGFSADANPAAGTASALASSLAGSRAEQVTVGRLSDTRLAARIVLAGGTLEQQAPGLYRLELPRVPGGLEGAPLELHREERTLALRLPGPVREAMRVVLTLPEGAEVVHAPSPVTVEGESGSLRRTVSLEGRELSLARELDVDRVCVPPEAYGGLRELMTAAEAPGTGAVLIRWSP
jgi:hypothetical protein